MNRSSVLLAAVALAAAAAMVRPGYGAEPSIDTLKGFGAAKFGSSVEETRALWPAMEPLGNDVKMPAAAFTSPHLSRYLLKDHAVAGLSSPVDVEFRFWEGKLWAFLVYFKPDDKDAALQHLEKSYGKRQTGLEDRPIWRSDAITLQAVAGDGWYGATDNALSDVARAWFFTALTGNPEGQAPAAAEPAKPGAAAAPPAPEAAPPAPAAATPGS
jgi:hypothetical protein